MQSTAEPVTPPRSIRCALIERLGDYTMSDQNSQAELEAAG